MKDYKVLRNLAIIVLGILIAGAIILYSFILSRGLLKVDLDGDGSKEEIALIKIPIKSSGGSIVEGFIKVKSKGKTFSQEIGTLEFSKYSYIKIIKVGANIKPFIGLFAPCGMHSLTFTLYSFDGNNIKEEIDILSDAPLIEIKDVDGDGTKEIVSFNRDYENNPVEDEIIETYKYKDNKWQLLSVYRTKTKNYEEPSTRK